MDKVDHGEKALIEQLEDLYREIVFVLMRGETVDEHLMGTPHRMAKAVVQDYFVGLWQNPDEIFSRGIWEGDSQTDQMILEKDIDFISFCAHHWSPFIGHAHVAYIPEKKLVGLSKIPRVVEIYSKRPQVQERLTAQIADCLMKNLEPKGVGVMLQAEHQCMACRGVKKSGIVTQTTALRGCFMEATVRGEFLMSVLK